MEIQTFFLADHIHVADGRHDARSAGVVFLAAPPGAAFPLRMARPAMILLHRESPHGDAPASLRFSLIDEDGKPAGRPTQMLVEGVFPAGNRFMSLCMEIDFEFPRPGPYRLDITADEGLAGSVHHYNLQVLPRQAGPHAPQGQQPGGPGRVEVHHQDMGGWVRVFTGPLHPVPEQLPVWLSHALTEWFRQRPQLRMRSVVAVTRGGETNELHAWYDRHVFPDALGQSPPARP